MIRIGEPPCSLITNVMSSMILSRLNVVCGKGCFRCNCRPLFSESLYSWTYLGSEVLPVAFDGDATVVVGAVKGGEVGTEILSIPTRGRTVLLFSYMHM